MVHAAFPEVAPRVKTKNWKGAFGIFTNRRLRQRIEWRTGEIESQRFWHRLTGTVVNGDDIFLKG
jgi:hypothetical protein